MSVVSTRSSTSQSRIVLSPPPKEASGNFQSMDKGVWHTLPPESAFHLCTPLTRVSLWEDHPDHGKKSFYLLCRCQSGLLASNFHTSQLFDSFIHAFHPERQMSQATSFRPTDPLRWIFFSKDFELCIFIHTQIKFPVIPFSPIVFTNDSKAQLLDIKLFCFFNI